MANPDRLTLELYRRSPDAFRADTIVDTNINRARLGDVMTPVQEQDFTARNATMLWLAGVPLFQKGKQPTERQRPQVRRFYSQRSRGYSKTSDIALDLLWLLIFSNYRLDGQIAAEDFDQAALTLKQAAKIVDANPWMGNFLEIQKKAILNPATKGQFICHTSDVASSFGQTPDVVFADEWSHWSDEEWWSSIYSSFGKKNKMIIVGCNACKTDSWQIELREGFIKDPLWYTSIPKGPAPWFSAEDLNSQRLAIPYLEYLRLWENVDSASSGKFIEKRFVEQCRDETLHRHESGTEHVPTYVVSIDYAERNDRTVVTVGHLYAGVFIIDRMDVIDPLTRENTTILVSEVLGLLDEIDREFGQHSELIFVFDKHQMAHAIQVLRAAGKTVEEFEFKSGIGNHQCSVLLQQYLMEGKVKWYPGCGEIYDQNGDVWTPRGVDDNLETELDSLLVKGNASRWRFDHTKSGHDDRAFTVAAALKYINDRLLAEAEQDYFESEGWDV